MSQKHDENKRISYLHNCISLLLELEPLFQKERRTKFGNHLATSKIASLQETLADEFDLEVSDAKDAKKLIKQCKDEISQLRESREKTSRKQNCFKRQPVRYKTL